MKLTLSLSKDDYLQHQLYMASKKPSLIKKRIRLFWIGPILGVLLLIVEMITSNDPVPKVILYTVLMILWFLFYPARIRKSYRNHYQNYVEESFADRVGIQATIVIEKEFLVSEDKTGEYKTRIDQIKEIIEINTHYFIKLNTGPSFIIPKRIDSESENTTAFIQQLVSEYNLSLVQELDWEWK